MMLRNHFGVREFQWLYETKHGTCLHPREADVLGPLLGAGQGQWVSLVGFFAWFSFLFFDLLDKSLFAIKWPLFLKSVLPSFHFHTFAALFFPNIFLMRFSQNFRTSPHTHIFKNSSAFAIAAFISFYNCFAFYLECLLEKKIWRICTTQVIT